MKLKVGISVCTPKPNKYSLNATNDLACYGWLSSISIHLGTALKAGAYQHYTAHPSSSASKAHYSSSSQAQA
jgi:hypothetical protein